MSKPIKLTSTHWRYISAIALIALIVPIIFITYYCGLPGRIIGLIVYFIIGVVAIYETTKVLGISYFTAVYLSLLLTVTFLLPDVAYIRDIGHGQNAVSTIKAIFSWKNTTTVLLGSLGIFLWERDLRKNFTDFFKNLIILLLIMTIIPIFAKTFTILNMVDYKYVIFFTPIAIVSDSFAYIGGKYLGKYIFNNKKLAPKISPKKTWAGAIIGYILGITFTILVGYFCHIWKDVSANEIVISIVIGLTLPAISQMGDLLFSSIKREKGIKDFSNLIPGHGGLMDRLDSLTLVTFVGALIYLFS